MVWKFLGLQKLLDGLFSDGWCQLGVPEITGMDDAVVMD